MFRNKASFYDVELLAFRPKSKPEDHPLSASVTAYSIYWRPFLLPRPEDAPCRGDRDPLMTRDSHVGQNHFLTIGYSKYIETVEHIRYLGTTLINQYSIHEKKLTL